MGWLNENAVQKILAEGGNARKLFKIVKLQQRSIWESHLRLHCDIYCSQTKLWEGNVFTGVCPSFCPWGDIGNITCIMGIGHTVGTYPPPPASDIWWSSLETCSILFTSGPIHPPAVLTSSGGHRSGRYASYWNALLTFKVHRLTLAVCI